MRIPWVSSYFEWLQQGAPTGEVERYPALSDQGETSVPGVYVAGDLTGVPLLKLAVQSGAERIRAIAADAEFREASAKRRPGVKQILILGGGPAGVAAGLECEALGLDYAILESNQAFATIENFPKGKPILAKPDDAKVTGAIRIVDGTKESLLADLKAVLAKTSLKWRVGERVTSIRPKNDGLEVETPQGVTSALRILLAIGKSGDARKLGVPGEDLPHVYNRLFDPGEFADQDILIVGGGDTALEAAIALAHSGNKVRLSYRKPALERPKPENLERFQSLVAHGALEPLFSTQVEAIEVGRARLRLASGETKWVSATQVFTLIGRDLPVAFFKRNGIRLSGDRDRSTWVFLAAMLSFFTMLYCGKSAVNHDIFTGAQGWWGFLSAYLTAPLRVHHVFQLQHQAWYGSMNFILAWLGSVVFCLTGPWSLGYVIARRGAYFKPGWQRWKHLYLIAVALVISWVYVQYVLGRDAGWSEGPTYWYSLLYTVTIAIFGARRMVVRKTRYIRWQTLSLIFVQAFFLFYLPFYGYDQWIVPHFDAQSYVREQIFPSGKWSSFGLVLFWPLNMGDFGKSTFWTWFPLVQTFGLLFWLVQRFGKGAYCGWICSCGGMAETLGDEVRDRTPHGKTPKRLENIGQGVLAFALIVTAMGFVVKQVPASAMHGNLATLTHTLQGLYKLLIDVFFAGVAGLGLYFYWGGRVWCRFGCPLAALMHLYSRFSVYRIVSEKKKCISCNACTKACHMGIDVMNFANKGIPLNDVECVRCSACVQICPTETLSLATLARSDTQNRSRESLPDYGKDDWRAGIR
jgi:NosR/NirI family transcriptional regulator, nitrous oxide reductase regulator